MQLASEGNFNLGGRSAACSAKCNDIHEQSVYGTKMSYIVITYMKVIKMHHAHV